MMKGKQLIGQLVAIPLDRREWMLGMVVECARAKTNNKLYYDIEWYSPNGNAILLIGYDQSDVNLFLNLYNDLLQDKLADWGAYELFLNEIEDALEMQRTYK